MGGPGSGNRSWKRTRPNLVEDAYALDLRSLVRKARLALGVTVAGQWEISTPIGNRRMTIQYHADLTNLEDFTLVMKFRIDGIGYRQRVSLHVTKPHLGGARLWFLCPITGQRARMLYLPVDKRQFASREAHGLVYRSQSETDLFRSITRAQNIRARLGGDVSIHAPFPARPRGMHHRTYQRLRDAALKIETAALRSLLVQEAARSNRISELEAIRR